MIYIGLGVIFFIILFDFWRNKNIFSPVFMFSSLFLLILSLALLKLNNIREYTDKSIYTIELGVIFFAIGALFIHVLFDIVKSEKKNKSLVKIEKKFEVNWIIIKVLTVLMIVGTVLTLNNALGILASGENYAQVRNGILGYDGGESMIANPVLRGLVNYISGPAMTALIPIAIYYFVKREHKIFTSLVFINLLISVFATGGRIILVYTAIQFMAVIVYSKIKISKKMKRVLIAIAVASLIIIVILSNVRSSNSFFNVVYAYFSGPVVLLSEWQKVADSQEYWTYGLSFFYPFTYVANMVTNLFGLKIELLNNAVMWQGAPQDRWFSVFPNMSMNAFATLFYFFYQDFRIFGIILYSTIFGAVSNSMYYKAYYEGNTKVFIMYLLLIKGIVGSFMIWQLGSTTFFMSSLMLYLCLRTKNKVVTN